MIRQVNRINEFLDAIAKRNILTPSDSPHLLSLTRQLLESQDLKSSYPVVNLYCNWCLHSEISGSSLGFEILREITEILNRDIGNNKITLTDPKEGVSTALRTRELREQLLSLFTKFGINTWIFENQNYLRFLNAILDAIEEDPISFPAKRKGKVAGIYSEIERIANNDPRYMIVSLLVTKDLSAEQLKFYNVPKGTFIWVSKTAFDSRLASVLYCPV